MLKRGFKDLGIMKDNKSDYHKLNPTAIGFMFNPSALVIFSFLLSLFVGLRFKGC